MGYIATFHSIPWWNEKKPVSKYLINKTVLFLEDWKLTKCKETCFSRMVSSFHSVKEYKKFIYLFIYLFSWTNSFISLFCYTKHYLINKREIGITASSPVVNRSTTEPSTVVTSNEANWLAVTKINVAKMNTRNLWLITRRFLLIVRCSTNIGTTSHNLSNTRAKSSNLRICKEHVSLKRTHTSKNNDVRYNQELMCNVHAIAWLK